MTETRLKGLPPRGRGIGAWYETPHESEARCPNCDGEHQYHKEQVAVLEYLPELDHAAYNRRKHPGWAETGWLAWWQCPTCRSDTFVPVSAEQVVEWGCVLGGWVRR